MATEPLDTTQARDNSQDSQGSSSSSKPAEAAESPAVGPSDANQQQAPAVAPQGLGESARKQRTQAERLTARAQQTPTEILQGLRESARKQKTQAERLTQDSAQVEKDIAELDSLLKEHNKAAASASEQASRWQRELEAAEAFQKSRAKGVVEELGEERKKAVIAALGDYQATVGALHVKVAEALRCYLAVQTEVAQLQAQHDSTKAALAVLRQHMTDTQKAQQTLDERRVAGFATLRKQIDSTVAPEPTYANLLFLRTDLDGVQGNLAPAPEDAEATPPAAKQSKVNEDAPANPESKLDFDEMWRRLSEQKEELRKRRSDAKAAKDVLDTKQAELDTLVQRRRADILKKLEPRS
ncbi:MAG: hypothetical protein AB7O44_26405 [Hyphomicrobiaceae bacterium]